MHPAPISSFACLEPWASASPYFWVLTTLLDYLPCLGQRALAQLHQRSAGILVTTNRKSRLNTASSLPRATQVCFVRQVLKSTSETRLQPSPRDYSSLPQAKGSMPWPPPLVSCQPAGAIFPPQPITVQPSLAPPSTFQKGVARRSLCTQFRSSDGYFSVPLVLLSVASLSLSMSLLSLKS